MKYSELLKDPRWQKKRLKILERDEFICRKCGDYLVTLHVHHCYYEYGKAPWDYEDSSLVTLCADCHACESTEHQNNNLPLFLSDLAKLGFLGSDFESLSITMFKNQFSASREDLMRVFEDIFSVRK